MLSTIGISDAKAHVGACASMGSQLERDTVGFWYNNKVFYRTPAAASQSAVKLASSVDFDGGDLGDSGTPT